jgi:peptide chain release factor 3
MEIERKRGISVTSSVMTFERDGLTFNLLDTPGHSDFSEDTYRTLTAVDSAVMVIDAARGIESQTLKLFEVCRLRNIPIITFINKVDREGLDPLELLDDIAGRLALDVTPVTWPIGMGVGFRGCLDLVAGTLGPAERRAGTAHLFRRRRPGRRRDAARRRLLPLVDEVAPDRALVPAGIRLVLLPRGTPHTGAVRLGAEGRVRRRNCSAPSVPGRPARSRSRPSRKRSIPADDEVTGFVFKVQANMDPSHRDRIAFARICSGHLPARHEAAQRRQGPRLTVSPIRCSSSPRTARLWTRR